MNAPVSEPVTEQTEPVGEPVRRGPRVEIVLYVVALLLACACVAGGVVLVLQHRSDERVEREEPESLPPTSNQAARYGDVKAAAEAVATALVNIDYRDPQASFDAVGKAATGDFLKQYQESSDSLVTLITQNHSVQTGKVLASGVVTLDDDGARVVVATSSTVTNLQTGDAPQQRSYRLRIDLVRTDGAWLVNDLEFV